MANLLSFPHFWLIFIGILFLFFSITMVIRHKPANWFLLHKILAVIGILFAILGIILLMGLKLNILHGIFGLIIAIWLIGEIFGGTYAKNKNDKKLRSIHIWLGRIVFLFVLINLVMGIITYSSV